MLCFLTDKMQLSVITYDATSNELVTVAMCDAQVSLALGTQALCGGV